MKIIPIVVKAQTYICESDPNMVLIFADNSLKILCGTAYYDGHNSLDDFSPASIDGAGELDITSDDFDWEIIDAQVKTLFSAHNSA